MLHYSYDIQEIQEEYRSLIHSNDEEELIFDRMQQDQLFYTGYQSTKDRVQTPLKPTGQIDNYRIVHIDQLNGDESE